MQSSNEAKLDYPWADQLPQPGHTITLLEGVRWLRMPLPFALDHINLWLLRDSIEGRDGWTIVDCGVATQETKDQWEALFENELQGLPVLRVIVTHMHPDHIGLAHWLCQRWDVPLYISMTDYMTARLWSDPNSTGAHDGPSGASGAAFFALHGLIDEEAQQVISGRGKYYPTLVPDVPKTFYRIMDGDILTIGGHEWRCIAGYGHAPEHISLACEAQEILISGDMLLPRISTNISVFNYEPWANPLPLYLNSLQAYQDLPEDTLVLPSHGKPFKGMHERIAQQHAHHAERLQEVEEACASPQSAYDILPVLFRRQLDMHQLTFAMGEAIAHLHALYYGGKLQKTVGDDGIIRFYSLPQA